MRNIWTRREAAATIQTGAVAVFAGSEATLASLPLGQWVGPRACGRAGR